MAQNAKDTPIPSRTGGFEGSLTGFCVVVCSGPVLEVKRPFTTKQSEHDKHSDDEIAK